MDNLLRYLQRVGVHCLKSDRVIILEVLDHKVIHANEIDVLINELLNQLQSSKYKKVRFECPKILLESLKYTKNRMEIIGERAIYTRPFTIPLDVSIPEYEIWSFFEKKLISFLSEVMGISVTGAEQFLIGMRTELPS